MNLFTRNYDLFWSIVQINKNPTTHLVCFYLFQESSSATKGFRACTSVEMYLSTLVYMLLGIYVAASCKRYIWFWHLTFLEVHLCFVFLPHTWVCSLLQKSLGDPYYKRSKIAVDYCFHRLWIWIGTKCHTSFVRVVDRNKTYHSQGLIPRDQK